MYIMSYFPPNKAKINPVIELNIEEELLNIEGNSLPENAYSLYLPIIKEFQDRSEILTKNEKIFRTVFKLNYFNSSSLKMIICILKTLTTIKGKDNLIIEWYYESAEPEMKETGEDIASLLNIPIKYFTK